MMKWGGQKKTPSGSKTTACRVCGKATFSETGMCASCNIRVHQEHSQFERTQGGTIKALGL
jgi:ribosomal protein L37E